MRLLRRLAGGVRALFSRSRLDRELDAELRAFLDAAIDEKMRRGATRDEATRAARLELGSTAAVRDHVRDAGWETVVETIWQDTRHSLRMLRRSPVFTIVTVLLLTGGIGVNTAIFTLVNSVLLRRLPVAAPEELVEPLSRYPGEPHMNGFSWEFYEHVRDRNTVFASVAGIAPARFQVALPGGQAESLDGVYAVGTLFGTLGLRPALGRLIEPDDARPGAAPVIVLSWSFWKRRFDLDPAVLGTQLTVDGVAATVVGVTPRAFTGLQTGVMPAVWRPVTRPMSLGLLARLKNGTSIEQARAELRVLHRWRIERIAESSKDPRWLQADIDLEPAATGLAGVRDRLATPLLVLMSAVGLLLLLACSNVASMLLARATARRHEMAVRVSLGAGRLRLARQVLIECAMLSAAGALLGIAIAHSIAGALVRIMTSGRAPVRWPAQLELQLAPDGRVLFFTALIAVLTALLFGLAPAWSAFTAPPVSSLRDAGRPGATASRRRFGQGLVVAQIALSVVLVSGAFALAGHLSRLRNHDLGFDRHGVLLVSVNPQGSNLDRTQLASAYRILLDRLQAIPGVRSATLSAVTPIAGSAASRFVTVDGYDEAPEARARVSLNWVAPRYFETFGTPLLAGRDFRFEDAGGPDVAIVNQALARHYFGGASPIGRRMTLEREAHPFEIVGVVADAKYADLREPAPRTVYLNAFQGRIASHFALRTTLPPGSIAPPVRRTIAEVVPAVTIAKVTTLDDQVNASIVIERVTATLSMLFAAAGAALAAIGLYGLLAYAVARRTGEIGLRLALGATQRDVLKMVLGGALALACTGVLAGLPLVWWTARVGARLFPDMPPGSIASVLVAAGGLLAVALLAALVPALRASRVQPADALRHV